MSDPFKDFMADWDKQDAERAKRDAAEDAAYTGCRHENLPVKYDAADCAGKGDDYVRAKYPRFYGACPDCGQHMIGYASFEHYVAGDW